MTLTGLLMVITVVLLGVLVGFAVPAIAQLRATLRSLERFLDETRPTLRETLAQLGETAARVNRLSDEAESTLAKVRSLLDTLDQARQPILSLRDNVRRFGTLIAALGPALVAGLGALWGGRAGGERPNPPGDASSSRPEAAP